MATRRAFLAGLAAAALPQMTWADAGNPAYLAAARSEQDHTLHGVSSSGDSLFHVSLPARGHAAAAHPVRAEAAAFARRPGTFALVVECITGQVRHRLTPPDGRQFNRHGAFSRDGTLLMTSEVIAEASQGRIGLWETTASARIGEGASGGIGPHDLRRLGDGRIVIANGGIRTDPDDRTKLNIDTMRPNLTLISATGAVLVQVELPADLHRNSIRHLALSGDTVAFAMQWQGDTAEAVPLLGFWIPGTRPRLAEAPLADTLSMKSYAGAIACSGDGDIVATTSPPGGAALVSDSAGHHLATHRRADLCGAAPRAGGIMLSDGQGAFWACDATGLPLGRSQVACDNHLVALNS